MDTLRVKNAKYAKECTEVNLSNRQISKIGNFELFPYLEVLVLNNNKLKRLDNLDANFRIKELFIDKNLMSNLGGSIRKFKFINHLSAAENNIRNLEKQLKVLSRFNFLEKLNLYGNPCASENQYRLKVIHAIPSLRILDNEEIDTDERIKVAKYVQSLDTIGAPKKNKKKPKAAKELSVGEKFLASQMRTLRREEMNTVVVEEEKKTFAWDTFKQARMPLAKAAAEMQHQTNVENQVTEWEKNWTRPVFFEYDINKNGYLDLDELAQVLNDLAADKAGIGKVPDIPVPSVIDIMDKWDKNKDGKINWREFRDGMNEWPWRLADSPVVATRVQELYKKAKWEESNGRMDGAKDMTMKALRLQGLGTRTAPIEPEARARTPPKNRADTMKIGGKTIVI